MLGQAGGQAHSPVLGKVQNVGGRMTATKNWDFQQSPQIKLHESRGSKASLDDVTEEDPGGQGLQLGSGVRASIPLKSLALGPFMEKWPARGSPSLQRDRCCDLPRLLSLCPVLSKNSPS